MKTQKTLIVDPQAFTAQTASRILSLLRSLNPPTSCLRLETFLAPVGRPMLADDRAQWLPHLHPNVALADKQNSRNARI